jgi:hypothetical protein
MRFLFINTLPFRIVALAIVGFVVVAAALYFSLHDLGKAEEETGRSHPLDHATRNPSPTPDPSQPLIRQPVVERAPASLKPEPTAVPESTPGIDVNPPLGSEAPVPAVFGLLAQSNVTNGPLAEGLEAIAEEFTEKVKQGGWDPTSEAYRTNWEKASQEADDTLRARYGTELYMKLKQNAAP